MHRVTAFAQPILQTRSLRERSWAGGWEAQAIWLAALHPRFLNALASGLTGNILRAVC